MNKHVADALERFRRMPVLPPPAPWHHVGTYGIGGLGSVGFGDGTDFLLVESTDGLGVFDCRSGQRVARDPTVRGTWEDAIALRAHGIGPLNGTLVRMAGLHGGGMPAQTVDRWSIEIISPDWPSAALVLQYDEQSVWVPERAAGCVKIVEVEDLRACGFSGTGRSLVVAEGSHTLHVFHRP